MFRPTRTLGSLASRLAVVIILAIAQTSFGQLEVSFNTQNAFVKPNEEGIVVCLPSEVTFTSTSTYNGVLIDANDADYTFQWDFGFANSALFSPQINYIGTPGFYPVRLTVVKISTGEESSFVKEDFAELIEPPSVDFEVLDTVGCVPFEVRFRDNSTFSGNPNAATFNWTVTGVGTTTGTEANLNITNPGFFPLTLVVVDAFSCRSSLTSPNVIRGLSKPRPEIEVVAEDDCNVPFEYSISLTPEDSLLTYDWQVNGRTFTGSNPADTEPSFGAHNIELSVSGPPGCTLDTIYNNALEIIFLEGSMDIPDTVCNGIFLPYEYTGTPSNNVLWQFPDGTSRSGTSFTYRFQNLDPGFEYEDICLTASLGTCADTVCDSLFISVPEAVISGLPTTSCIVPFEVDLIGSNSFVPPGYQVRWTVDGVEYSDLNAVHTFQFAGGYLIELEIFNEDGCESYASHELLINTPFYFPSTNFPGGCVPKTFEFTGFLDDPKFTSQIWTITDSSGFVHFADSNISTTFFDYTLNEPGVYKWRVEVIDTAGCGSVREQDFSIGTTPVADFELAVLDTCASTPFELIDQSYVLVDGVPNYDLVNFWFWDTDYGTNSGSSPVYTPIRTAIDTLNGFPKNSPLARNDRTDVTLVASYNGCNDTLVKEDYASRWGPVLDELTQSYDCEEDALTIRAYVTLYTSFQWVYTQFNQQTQAFDTVEMPLQTFPSYDFDPLIHSSENVELKLLNLEGDNGFNGTIWARAWNNAYPTCDSCFYEEEITINNLKDFDFDLPDTLCFSDENGRARVDLVQNGLNEPYRWTRQYGGGVEIAMGENSNIVFSPSRTGTYTICLKKTESVGCASELCKQITFTSPRADINSLNGSLSGCPNSPILVEGEELNDAIINWDWVVEEISDISNPDTVLTLTGQTPPEFAISEAGNYRVKLIATDVNGCISTSNISEEFSVRNPVARANITRFNYCEGDSLEIDNTSTFNEELTYTWYEDGIIVSTEEQPSLFFTGARSRQISLLAESGVCKDSLVLEDSIYVQPIPDFDFVGTPLIGNCPPLITNFSSNILSDPSFSYQFKWDFGDPELNPATNQNTVASYNSPGQYDVGLVVTTSFGCTDTLVKPDYVQVLGPRVDSIQISSDQLCVGETICASIFGAADVEQFTFNFGDGTATTLTNPNIQGPTDTLLCHNYTQASAQPVILSILLKNVAGCETVFSKTAFVGDVKTQFANPEDTLCGIPYELSPQNAGSGFDRTFYVLNAVDTITQVPIQLIDTGLYELIMVGIDDESGCSDSDTLNLALFNTPVFTPLGDTVLCESESLILELSGTHTYSWIPSQGITDDFGLLDSSRVLLEPDVSKRYTVIGKDTITTCEAVQDFKVFRDSTLLSLVSPVGDSCAPGELVFDGDVNFAAAEVQWNIAGPTGDSVVFGVPMVYPVLQAGLYQINLGGWDKSPRCRVDTTFTFRGLQTPNPVIRTNQPWICNYDSVLLQASGADFFTWSSTAALSDNNEANTYGFPTENSSFKLIGQNANGCIDSTMVEVGVAREFIFSFDSQGDSIFLGESSEIDIRTIDSLLLLPFETDIAVTPEVAFNCPSCFPITVAPSETTDYLFTAVDSAGCYQKSFLYTVFVKDEFFVDLPTAFSPNNDGVNDILYFRGTGVKELQYFRIYNRFGELVFETNDINEGWDGTYKGALQNDANYVYQVVVAYLNGEIKEERGYISILK